MPCFITRAPLAQVVKGRCGDLNSWVYCSVIDFILLIRVWGTFLCNSWGTAWVSAFIKVYSWAGTWNKVSWAWFYYFVHEASFPKSIYLFLLLNAIYAKMLEYWLTCTTIYLFIFSGHFTAGKSLHPAPPEFLPNHSSFELEMLKQWQVYEPRQIVCSWKQTCRYQFDLGRRCFQCCGQADVCREHGCVWHFPAPELL